MLHLHRAARADALAGALGDLLALPAADPFAPELIAVPTRGMERWLSQRLSHALGARPEWGDGVCANVLFPTPHRLLGDAVALASGVDPQADPWLPERATWRLLEVVDAALGEPWLAPLATYLGGADGAVDRVRRDRRLSIVRHLAVLFDRYALHRPAMLAAWAEGRNDAAAGRALPEGAVWQAELWRRLRARIAVPGPAERRTRACARIRAKPACVELPSRLALFGLTRLPAGHLHVLRAIAENRDVHLMLLHPSDTLWRTITAAGSTARPADGRRVLDTSGERVTNRLLASWGRDAREMQLVLGGLDAAREDRDTHHPLPEPPLRRSPARSAPQEDAGRVSRHIGGKPSPRSDPAEGKPSPQRGAPAGGKPSPQRGAVPGPTLLARLQADIRGDRAAPGVPLPGEVDRRAVLDSDDESLTIHACHGRVRQVEVLRDAILHALAEDPTLEPRDVIVMCPDVESYAPLIQATFGAGVSPDGDEPGAHRAIDLRVRLADRSLTQTNAVLGVVSALLELVERRVTASEVLDLIDRPPLRRRFGFDDDDLARLGEWITRAGVRWGLDAEHRAPWQLQAVPEGTWRAGLDRLLLGVAMTEDDQRLFGGTLPLDDVDSRAIELAGRCAELVERLGSALDALSRPRPLTAWARALAEAADALTLTPSRERWQRAELQRILDELVDESAAGEGGPDLTPAEVRAHLAARLAGRPTRANFRTGHLTVCTLQPMRSVPHRVVCLLGLDDGAFPRRTPRDGDDLLLADPHVGERDPRSEDRQLLLDALLAAGERLIITYTGNDERTNVVRPPAVPVGELLDAVDATVRAAEAAPRASARTTAPASARASERMLVRHPLQPFDRRNFEPDALASRGAWSFDEVALRGARALVAPRLTPTPFLPEPLAPLEEPDVQLEDLVAFVGHPVRAFLRRRLGITLRSGEDETSDALPLELEPLARWDVANRLLGTLLGGSTLRVAVAAEKVRGTLPPGALGDGVIDGVRTLVTEIAARAATLAGDGVPRDPFDILVDLADPVDAVDPAPRQLVGTVTGVRGQVLLSASFSRVAPRHRISAWVRLLALSAAHPEEPFAAATVGRGHGRDDVRVCWIPPLGATPTERREAALGELRELVDLHARGLREPLPLYARTSAAWAEAAHLAGGDAAAEAARAWESGYRFEGEDADLHHQLVLGGQPGFGELLRRLPATSESGVGWQDSESTRVGRLARRLWDGLLAREQTSAR